MARVEKTVFVSYRRTAVSWALAIYQDLTHNGYDVFIDYNDIGSGDFAQVIADNIRARAHFLVLLTPTSLERCREPNDWLRREIEIALDARRNIVPVLLEGADFGAPPMVRHLKGSIEVLQRYNAVNMYAEYFSAVMDRLRQRHLNVPLEAVLHAPSATASQAAQEQQAAASAAQIVEPAELAGEEWLDLKRSGQQPPVARPSASWGPRAETEVMRWLSRSREGLMSVDSERGYFRLHRTNGTVAFVEVRLVGADPHLARQKIRPAIEGARDRAALPFILFLVAASKTVGWNALPVLAPYLRSVARPPENVQVVLAHLDSEDMKIIQVFGHD